MLVLGATGRFGGIVEALLERGHRVRAGARDPDGPAAARLAALGAEVVHADFEDPASLRAAARSVAAVFATGTAHQAGPQGEARHGHNLADALSAVDASHLVFVSGAGADPRSKVPVLRAKGEVERRIAQLGLPATVLAPVYLMENLLNPWNRPALATRRLPTPVRPSIVLQQVAVAEIVEAAVAAIARRRELVGERIELASDELSGVEQVGALSRTLGVDLVADQLPRAKLPPPVASLFDWLSGQPFAVDIAALRARFPEVRWQGFAAWAEEHEGELAQAVNRDTGRRRR